MHGADTEGTFRPSRLSCLGANAKEELYMISNAQFRIQAIAERYGVDPAAVLDNISYARGWK